MNLIRFTTEIGDDLLIHLPQDIVLQRGKVEVIVAPISDTDDQRPARTSLAEWADQHAEQWGTAIDSSNVAGFTGRAL